MVEAYRILRDPKKRGEYLGLDGVLGFWDAILMYPAW